MSDSDAPRRFMELAKQASRGALTDAGLRERFGEPGEAEIRIGQVWRARRDEISVLVLILDVEDREVRAAPVTVDPPAEDDHCLVVGGSSTAFGVDATVWGALASPVPIRVLDRVVDVWTAEATDWVIAMTHGRSQPVPTGAWRGHSVGSEIDPVASFRAELADEIEILRQAPELPMATSKTRATKGLASLLGDRPDIALLCSALRLRQPEVMKILRGKLPLTPEQIHAIAGVTGLAAEEIGQALRPLPVGLVLAAEHPRWRRVWRERADQQRVSEEEARLSVSYKTFALAARETGGREPDWNERLRHFLVDEDLGAGGA